MSVQGDSTVPATSRSFLKGTRRSPVQALAAQAVRVLFFLSALESQVDEVSPEVCFHLNSWLVKSFEPTCVLRRVD